MSNNDEPVNAELEELAILVSAAALEHMLSEQSDVVMNELERIVFSRQMLSPPLPAACVYARLIVEWISSFSEIDEMANEDFESAARAVQFLVYKENWVRQGYGSHADFIAMVDAAC